MIKATYFAVCPTAELILELKRLKLDGEGVESVLFSEKTSDRRQTPIADRIAKVKGTFLALFRELLDEQQIDSVPFVDHFERYWRIHVFKYCEDIDESISDLAGRAVMTKKTS